MACWITFFCKGNWCGAHKHTLPLFTWAEFFISADMLEVFALLLLSVFTESEHI